ncbi:jg2605, partial [Pararge aegeria aegeria]
AGNHPDDYSRISYRTLLDVVCQFSNALRSHGVKKGDRVSIYMPMILETVVCMLACARIGAIHSVVFAGFSPDCLAERMADCKAKVLVTSDCAWRGEKLLTLKKTCDEALEIARTKKNHKVDMCIVVAHLKRVTPCGPMPNIETLYEWHDDIDVWWHDIIEDQSTICQPEWMGAEDPLFMLYTSGSTGKPKGVLHTTAGYLLYATATFRYVFDYRPQDIYWCTADVGWITGHTYVVYAPLANRATSVLSNLESILISKAGETALGCDGLRERPYERRGPALGVYDKDLLNKLQKNTIKKPPHGDSPVRGTIARLYDTYY